jgi:hypothetical protein
MKCNRRGPGEKCFQVVLENWVMSPRHSGTLRLSCRHPSGYPSGISFSCPAWPYKHQHSRSLEGDRCWSRNGGKSTLAWSVSIFTVGSRAYYRTVLRRHISDCSRWWAFRSSRNCWIQTSLSDNICPLHSVKLDGAPMTGKQSTLVIKGSCIYQGGGHTGRLRRIVYFLVTYPTCCLPTYGNLSEIPELQARYWKNYHENVNS